MSPRPIRWFRAWEITSPGTLPALAVLRCCSVSALSPGKAQNSSQSPSGGALEVAQFGGPWSWTLVASLGAVPFPSWASFLGHFLPPCT